MDQTAQWERKEAALEAQLAEVTVQCSAVTSHASFSHYLPPSLSHPLPFPSPPSIPAGTHRVCTGRARSTRRDERRDDEVGEDERRTLFPAETESGEGQSSRLEAEEGR
jgi:hypothetical protein